MSKDNVEAYRFFYEAWNAGDMDAVGDLYDDFAVLRAPEGWPEPGPWIGAEAISRQWKRQRDPWDKDTIEPVGDFIDAGDRVMVRFAWHGTGRGPELNAEATAIVTFRGGKIVYHEIFWDHDEALAVLGLSK
jgi:ketosteroid isomerase-like protein